MPVDGDLQAKEGVHALEFRKIECGPFDAVKGGLGSLDRRAYVHRHIDHDRFGVHLGQEDERHMTALDQADHDDQAGE